MFTKLKSIFLKKETKHAKQIETVKSEVIKPVEQIKEVKKEIQYSKPKHADCNCFKCVRWRKQNAK